MPILNIEPATRAGMKLLISLYGMSETGKTLSALRLACGIEPDPKKRLLLDTEGGQRGRAYVDHVPGGYMYAALSPPFTPERYIQAIDDIEAAGINVVVVDSASHAWFAEGGVLDMVESDDGKNEMAKWKKPKRRLGKLTRRWLSSDMHVILCSRGKQPLIDNGAGKNPRYELGPVVPVQEKTLRFDMTVMAQMLGDGRFTVAAPAGKCPGALRPIFTDGEVMSEEMGRKLVAWVAGAEVRTPEQRKLDTDSRDAAEKGSEAFRAWWKDTDKAAREYLRPQIGNLQSIAAAADAEAERIRQEEADQSGLDDPFGSPASGAPVTIQDATAGDPETGEVTTAAADAQPDPKPEPYILRTRTGAPIQGRAEYDDPAEAMTALAAYLGKAAPEHLVASFDANSAEVNRAYETGDEAVQAACNKVYAMLPADGR